MIHNIEYGQTKRARESFAGDFVEKCTCALTDWATEALEKDDPQLARR